MKIRNYIFENFIRSRNLARLPERIQTSLREREHANGILVRLVQLAIVVIFTILYALSSNSTQNTTFQPVPYVLGLYLILSLISLLWSIRSVLPKWALYLSILLDFGLLYGVIVSFHYQYNQPASFVLKAPALLYVFIFIALRALRLDWKYVATAGIVAAAGWLAVIVYVINVDNTDTMITRSYVAYLTSNTILIGAEIDKIISILAVTAILVLVVRASNNFLVSAVTEQMAANDFSKFFDKQVAENIRSSDGHLLAGYGQRREIAVINIDIRNFSHLAAKHEPHEVMHLLSVYQSQLVPLLQKGGAVIDKFMGDGIMATIGLDGNSPTYSRTAVELAEAVLKDSLNWQENAPELLANGPLQIGIGIAQGEVSFGTVGDGERLEMTVIGVPVNTSAKLEKHNKVLGSQCLVSHDVWGDALKQGYAGSFVAVFHDEKIEGIEETHCIAELKLQ